MRDLLYRLDSVVGYFSFIVSLTVAHGCFSLQFSTSVHIREMFERLKLYHCIEIT